MKITHEGAPAPRFYVTDTGGNPVLPNPDDPPPPADEVDVALDADAFVPIAAATSPAIVQFKNHQYATTGTRSVTLDATPTPGNILVCYYSSRSGVGAGDVTGPTGWTAHTDSPVYGGILISTDPGCPTFAWWHVVETGEGSTVTVEVGGDAGNPANISVIELEGVADLIDEPSANQVTDDNPKLTGTTDADDAIFLVGADVQQDGTPLVYTPDSGSTELYDDSIGGDTWPHQWVGYRIVTAGAGSYDVGATGAFSLPWGALGFVFDTGGTGVSQQVAPLTVDGDDATYNESALEEIVRLDIGTAQRLTSSHLLVGYDSSGSRTVHLWAGNASDLSDAVEVTSETFSATGGGTGDDVVFTIADTTAYRYWEFRGPVEHTKTYTVEMFAFQQSFDLSGYQLLSEKGDPSGYAGLDGSAKVAVANLPDVEALATSETDDTLVLAPDGAGGVEFRAETGGGMTNPMTTAGDLIVGDTGGTPARLAKGSDGDVLTVDPTTHLLVWAAPSPAADITDIPTAETDTALVLAPDGAGGVEWVTPTGGGGGLTQAFAGYNTVGGSWGSAGVNSQLYAKKVTLANDCLISSIGAYIQHASGTAKSLAVALYTDSSGPDKVIAYNTGVAPIQNLSSGARWLDVPIGAWVTAGDYWLVIRTTDLGGTVVLQVAYDATGSDHTATGIIDAWYDWSNYSSFSTTSNKYSIRANTIR